MIYTSITQFKEFIGGGANVSLELDSINPTALMAAHEHLVPWIGEDLWEDLVANVQAPNAVQTALLPFVQRPLAYLTMLEYSEIGNVQFTESGLQRAENEHMKSAYKYQETAYKAKMLKQGYEAIEMMLKHLDTNAATYPLWSAAYQARNRELFINYASEFRLVYSKYLSRYTFECLRPLMQDVECFAILPCIGQDLFDRLKTSVSGRTTDNFEDALIGHIQRAIANFTIEEGTRRLWVRIEGRNVIQSETLGDQGYEKTQAARNVPNSEKMRHHETWAERHLSKVKDYLNNNIDEFPEWKDLLEAQKEETDSDECCDFRDTTTTCCSKNSNQAIVRL